MSYGLKFTGANNQVIFDSDNFGDAEILTPLDGHPTTSSTSFDFAPSDLVFVRVTGTHTLSNGTAATLRGNVTYSGSTRTLTLSQSTSYFIARRTSSVSGDHTGAGTYGLQIKNSSGDITFSTRKSNNSINVIQIFDNFEVSHNQTFFSGATGGTDPVFVSIGHMFSQAPSTFGCFDFFTDGIKYNSQINANPFGTFSLPNFGSLIVARVRS